MIDRLKFTTLGFFDDADQLLLQMACLNIVECDVWREGMKFVCEYLRNKVMEGGEAQYHSASDFMGKKGGYDDAGVEEEKMNNWSNFLGESHSDDGEEESVHPYQDDEEEEETVVRVK